MLGSKVALVKPSERDEDDDDDDEEASSSSSPAERPRASVKVLSTVVSRSEPRKFFHNKRSSSFFVSGYTLRLLSTGSCTIIVIQKRKGILIVFAVSSFQKVHLYFVILQICRSFLEFHSFFKVIFYYPVTTPRA